MTVSLITATFNSQDSIGTCIESVNNQTYKNIEHIFVDGGSVDNTLNIIHSKSTRKKIIVSENDQGIYDALNKGIKLSTGDVIGLVHSDDFLANNKIIADVVSLFAKNDVDGVYGDLLYVNKNDVRKIIRYWKDKPFKENLILTGWMPAHPTLFLRKTVYDKYGYYDLTYKIAADYNFILKILRDKSLRLSYLPKVITKMRIGGESNKSITNIMIKSMEDYRAIKANKVKNPLLVLFKKNSSKLIQFFPVKNRQDFS